MTRTTTQIGASRPVFLIIADFRTDPRTEWAPKSTHSNTEAKRSVGGKHG